MSKAPGQSSPSPQEVPDALMQKLRDATTRFHAAREQLDFAMGDSQYRHQERVNEKESEFQKAEKALEEVNEEIRKAINR